MPRKMAREPRITAPTTAAAVELTSPPASPANTTKIERVRALLQRNEGATIAEMIEVTAWLPHTTRAALTGLKKKGAKLEKSKRGDVTCYRIVDVAQ